MNTLSIRSIFIITIAALLFAASASAQNGQGNNGIRAHGSDRVEHHRPADAETRVAHLTRVLDLSDDQSAALLEILQSVDQERRALHEQAFQQIEPEICALQQNVKTEIENILTEEQLAVLEARKNNREGDRFGRSWRGMHMDCSAYE